MNLAPVLSLFGHRKRDDAPVPRDWSQQELAQFYRVQWVLQQAGIGIECDRGLSDEGDPWFVFCRTSDAEVIVHIARDNGCYLLAGFMFGGVERGRNLNDVIERVLSNPASKAVQKNENSNVVMHPATLLALIVSIAFFRQSEAAAASGEGARLLGDLPAASKTLELQRLPSPPVSGPTQSVSIEANQALALLRVVTIGTNLAIADIVVNLQPAGADDFGRKAGEQYAEKGVDVTAIAREVATDTELKGDEAKSYLADVGQIGRSADSAEKFLETIALLWSKGRSHTEAPGIGEAASGFTDASIVTNKNPTAGDGLLRGDVIGAPAPMIVDEGLVAEGNHPSSIFVTISIVASPAGSIAKALLKVTAPGLSGSDFSVSSTGAIGAVYNSLFEMVSRAKASLGGSEPTKLLTVFPGLPEETTDALGQPEGVSESKPVEASKAVAPADPTTITLPFKTVSDGRSVTHTVTDDSARPFVERAIAAFKEDVSDLSLVINGDDVILFSRDAVISGSPRLVVELWQFEDGSSIGLVGIDHGNSLPYSF